MFDISEDVRTLPVEWDAQGTRYKEFKKAVSESTEHSIDDAELQGGQTALFMLKKMFHRGNDPKGWLLEFSRENQLTPKDRTWHELQTLTLAVHLAGTHDALNLGSLACIEALARRLAAIPEAYRGGPGVLPKWEGTRHILGISDPFSLMSSELRSHVVRSTREEIERESAYARARVTEPAGAPGAASAATWGVLPRQPDHGGKDRDKGGKDKGKGGKYKGKKGDGGKSGGAGAAEQTAPAATAW